MPPEPLQSFSGPASRTDAAGLCPSRGCQGSPGAAGRLFSLSESHPVSGRSQPRTGNPRGVQPSTSLLSRKQPGWSRLRLRPWLQRCPATWGATCAAAPGGQGPPGCCWHRSSVAMLAFLPSLKHTSLLTAPSFCFYCVQATCDCSSATSSRGPR